MLKSTSGWEKLIIMCARKKWMYSFSCGPVGISSFAKHGIVGLLPLKVASSLIGGHEWEERGFFL